MPPRRSFDDQLAFGHEGERVVEQWLQSIGFACLPAYDFSERGAPSLRRGTWQHSVPDILGASAGKSFWFEVKTHATAAINRRRGVAVHGVRKRLWEGYQAVAKETGIPVFVLVLEVDTGALLVANVDQIVTWPCECEPCRGGNDHACFAPLKRSIYFRRDDMALRHVFPDSALTSLRERRAA